MIQILQSHSPQYGDVQAIYQFSLNFKMAATDQLHNLLWLQKLKLCKKLIKF